MITVFRSNQIYRLQDLKICIKKQIEQLPRMISSIGNLKTIFRFEFECEKINLLTWLHNQKVSEKMYWSERKGDFESAGIHSADTISGKGSFDYQSVFDQIEQKLSADNVNLKYFGGFCFDSESISNDWSDFGSYRFVAPRFELVRNNDQYTFALNIGINDINENTIAQILKEIDDLDLSSDTIYRNVPKITTRQDRPSYSQWEDIFKSAIEGNYEKIVLARQTNFTFDIDIRPSALIKFLKDQSPNCHHFCFQPKKNYGFLGATPERLFKMTKEKLKTEAVAGTTPKGLTKDECKEQEYKLLNSEKLQREHSFVVDHIKNQLKLICSHYDFDQKPDVLKLKNGQHLITKFEGHVKYECHLNEIIQNLHPTPAVAGYPVKGIYDSIRQLEPFSRGWYAAPVGYIGYDQCEFAVAIRSGLIRNNRLSLFAGAGIVDGSTVEEEWKEIENKISRFMKVFDENCK